MGDSCSCSTQYDSRRIEGCKYKQPWLTQGSCSAQLLVRPRSSPAEPLQLKPLAARLAAPQLLHDACKQVGSDLRGGCVEVQRVF